MTVRRCVCPGSFDPVTNGHLDVIERASHLFDEVYVLVTINKNKTGMFTVEERLEMLSESTVALSNVLIDSFHGLLVDWCKEHDVHAIVKGLRAVTDFDYELQMAQMNHRLSGVDTVFVPTSPDSSFLSSSLVKEVATWGGDVSSLVPEGVLRRLTARAGQ